MRTKRFLIVACVAVRGHGNSGRRVRCHGEPDDRGEDHQQGQPEARQEEVRRHRDRRRDDDRGRRQPERDAAEGEQRQDHVRQEEHEVRPDGRARVQRCRRSRAPRPRTRKAACGEAQVGAGDATAALPFGPGGARQDFPVVVTAFNNARREGHPPALAGRPAAEHHHDARRHAQRDRPERGRAAARRRHRRDRPVPHQGPGGQVRPGAVQVQDDQDRQCRSRSTTHPRRPPATRRSASRRRRSDDYRSSTC